MKIFFVLLVSIFSCKSADMRFNIKSHKTHQHIPSASGIAQLKDSFYVIGDDSPYLFMLDKEFELISQTLIYPYEGEMLEGRIPKPDKPDIEALESVGENEIIGFGSGSKSPQRDVFIHISVNDSIHVESYSLTSFYNILKNMDVLQGHELNIEAAAYFSNKLYLFNRGKNVIFSMDYQEFLNHVSGDALCPNIEFETYSLPTIKGIEAGFSGATASQDGELLLVTSSVEDTDNAYDDGEVLGSYIGVITLDSGRPIQGIQWTEIDSINIPLKVESILIEKELGTRNMDVVLVTDNDGGASVILRGNLRW